MNIRTSPSSSSTGLPKCEVRCVGSSRSWLNSRSSIATITICLSLLALTGCQNLVNVKNLDLGFGGLEIEFYEPAPVIVQTNLINLEADIIPKLMQRRRK